MPRTPAAADSRAHATFSAFSLGAFSLGSFFSFFPLGALRSELIPEIHSLVPSALTWGRDGYHALHDSHATRCRDAVSIYLSVYLSIHPPIYLSIYPYLYLSSLHLGLRRRLRVTLVLPLAVSLHVPGDLLLVLEREPQVDGTKRQEPHQHLRVVVGVALRSRAAERSSELAAAVPAARADGRAGAGWRTVYESFFITSLRLP